MKILLMKANFASIAAGIMNWIQEKIAGASVYEQDLLPFETRSKVWECLIDFVKILYAQLFLPALKSTSIIFVKVCFSILIDF